MVVVGLGVGEKQGAKATTRNPCPGICQLIKPARFVRCSGEQWGEGPDGGAPTEVPPHDSSAVLHGFRSPHVRFRAGLTFNHFARTSFLPSFPPQLSRNSA
jgi:hypothetical protein